ncbi:MAG: glycosyltransferase family 2 protein [Clostridia bacterium]|nr:glycosyltransferase family 2 protein [Clostridia bacterium]
MVDRICALLGSALGVLMAYFAVYWTVGLFCKAKKPRKAEKQRRFGVIIAARNEEKVIGALLDSIKEQSYPRELVTVFCVADNCTDATASIAGEKGAVVYERTDPTLARKGYALEFLFDNIGKDHGISAFDAFVFFDADNTLDPRYLEEMNAAMDSGADVVTGYRMASNFDDNFISAAYGIHFLRSNAFAHRPRSLLGISTHVAGTGFGVRSAVLEGGWHFHSLTEDTEFTMWAVSRGLRIDYCESAMFFDEQPVSLRVAVRQRIRWIKGRLFCFVAYAAPLIRGLFSERGRGAFSCYDMFFYIFPKALFNFMLSLTSAVFAGIALRYATLAEAAYSLLISALGLAAVACATVIRERKNVPIRGVRLLWFVLAFPWFDLVALPLSLFALFAPVKWKPIPHTGKRGEVGAVMNRP